MRDGELDPSDLDAENEYSNKIDGVTYEPTGDKPALASLFNDEKAQALRDKVNAAAGLSDELRDFLLRAADRHTVFNFKLIADRYPHEEPAVQALYEESALVIIDFDKAISHGFVELTARIAALAASQKPQGDEDKYAD